MFTSQRSLRARYVGPRFICLVSLSLDVRCIDEVRLIEVGNRAGLSLPEYLDDPLLRLPLAHHAESSSRVVSPSEDSSSHWY